MSILLRLFAELIRILVRYTFQAAIMLLGCFVRLLYWSVRTYGWRRVLGFFGLLTLSSLVYFRLLTAMPLGIQWLNIKSVLIGIPFLMLIFWGVGKWGLRGVHYVWRGFLSSLRRCRSSKAIACSPSSGPLWKQVTSWDNLARAWQRVETNGGSAGPDGITLEAYTMDWESRLRQLREDLVAWRYRPRPPRRVEVPKRSGGMRGLAIFDVCDRIVQQSINQVLLPLWDERFAPCSYAYRPGRSALQAANAVEKALQNGRSWIVDADIESFFDSVSVSRLLEQLESWLPDASVRSLISLILTTAHAGEYGLSQGSPLSPLLSNLYLHSFDEVLLERGYAVCRYSDDFAVLCPTREQADEALQTSKRLLRALQLRLNDQKTRIVHISESFTFLGFTFTPEGKHPSERAVSTLKDRLRNVPDETKRHQIESGWRAYFGEALQMDEQSNERVRVYANAQRSSEDDALHREADPGSDGEGASDFRWLDDTMPNDTPVMTHEDEMSEENSAADQLALSNENWNVYRQRFVGREDLFARYWQNEDGRCGYIPVRRAITRADVEDHLSGRCILGTYLLDTGSEIRSLVFDVDGPTLDEIGRQKAHHLAVRIMVALREEGISPLLFDSGGKGRHLWFCFTESIPAKPVRQWAQSLLDRFCPFPEGVFIEIFPKQDFLSSNALGSMLRLPLGRHPKTSLFGSLLDQNGQKVRDPWMVLRTYPSLDSEQAASLIHSKGVSTSIHEQVPDSPEAIAPMIQGCALLRGLIEKAARENHLKHTERLALLYALGHCGDAGRSYIHKVMVLCSNYDPHVTERFLQRLEPGHKPIGCFRLREWLKDYLPDVSCKCTKRKTSPLDLLSATEHPSQKPSSPVSNQEWEMVAEELFGPSEDASEE